MRTAFKTRCTSLPPPVLPIGSTFVYSRFSHPLVVAQRATTSRNRVMGKLDRKCIAALLVIICICLNRLLLLVTVRGSSMSPGLIDGDRVLVARYWSPYLIRRGVIVVVRPRFRRDSNQNISGGNTFIKRVVYIHGDNTDNISNYDRNYHEHASITSIPKGYIFLMGDNRDESYDSRIWGPLPVENVLGVVICKISRTNVDR